MTAIKTFAVAIANKTKGKVPEVEASAQTIVAAANHIYDGMHNIIRQLRPGALDNLGLSETLRDAVNFYQNQYPELTINLSLSGNLDALGETLNINIYRIVQESINNVIKHAKATTIDIVLTITDTGALQLTIKDNGLGMDMDELERNNHFANHFGLIGMRERVQGLHGSFSVDSETDPASARRGTVIRINIPQAIKTEGEST